MKQFVVMMQRFDTPEDCLRDYYLDFGVNDVFSKLELACEALDEAIYEEIDRMNEDAAGNVVYFRDGDCIKDQYGSLIASYTVQAVEVDNPSAAANKALSAMLGYPRVEDLPLRVEAYQIDGKGTKYYTLRSHLRSFKKSAQFTSPSKAMLAACALLNNATIGTVEEKGEK